MDTDGHGAAERNQTRAAGFNTEDAKVFAEVAKEVPPVFLCENLGALCVYDSWRD